MPNIPTIIKHPLKQDIYDKLDAGVSPHKIYKWLKKLSEKDGKDYIISVPTLYKYKKRRRLKTEKDKVKKEIKANRHSKEISTLEKDIKKIDRALGQYDLSHLNQTDARSYRELINAKIRLIKSKNDLIDTYDEEEKDISQQMTTLFTRIRKQEEMENKDA